MKDDRYNIKNMKIPSVALQAMHIKNFAEEIENTQKELNDSLDNLSEVLGNSMMALLLTRDYVGENKLPDVKGWSWYDSCMQIMEILRSSHPACKEFKNRLTCLNWRIVEEIREGEDLYEVKAAANDDGIIIVAHWVKDDNGHYSCRVLDTEYCEWRDKSDDDIGYVPSEPYILYKQNIIW